MNFSHQDTLKIASLAKISVSASETEKFSQDLGNIFDLINEMNAIDTEAVAPMYNPHDMTLRLRDDAVTEENQREKYQTVAPATEDGLYLVPKVIE